MGALTNEQGLKADLDRLRELNAGIEAVRSELASRLEAEKTRADDRARELAELKALNADTAGERERAREALDRLQQELAAKDEEKAKLAVRLAGLRRRVENLGTTLAERTYLAIRSLEVERLRERLGQAIARMLEAEKRGRASEGAAARLAGQSARLAVRLKTSETKRSELAEQCVVQKAETNKRERDIGQLRRELEAARGELKTLIKMLGGKAAPAKT